jgi:proline dehydrogenase
VSRALAAVRGALTARAGRAYVAGPSLREALAVGRRARDAGLTITIARWGGRDSDRETLAAAGALAAGAPGAWMGLKLPALRFAVAELDPIGERCRAGGVPVMLDAHVADTTDRTLALGARLRAAGVDVGCALPGRWARAQVDAERALAGDLTVRIIKGQWPDPAGGDVDALTGFLALVDRLAGRARRVSLGTHDPVLAREGLRRLAAAGTPAELEVLLGVPAAAAIAVARTAGVPVRVYIPYGTPDVPYDPAAARRDRRLALRLARDTVARPCRALAAAG